MPFPPETRRKLFGENALTLFGIDEHGTRLPR
jgi:predicted TIM-barrel fold metal-dependent hydrolase